MNKAGMAVLTILLLMTIACSRRGETGGDESFGSGSETQGYKRGSFSSGVFSIDEHKQISTNGSHCRITLVDENGVVISQGGGMGHYPYRKGDVVPLSSGDGVLQKSTWTVQGIECRDFGWHESPRAEASNRVSKSESNL